jgi:hypothetical protein
MKQKTLIGWGRLVETAATMEKSKTLRCFSHSCLDKPSQQTCSAYPQFQQARRRLINKIGKLNKKRETYSKTRLLFDSSRPLNQ